MDTEGKKELASMAIQMVELVYGSSRTGDEVRENVKNNYELLVRLIEGEK